MKSKFSIILLITLSLFYSCSTPVDSGPTESAAFTLSLSLTGAPAAVHSINGILERNGFDTINRDFTVEGDSATANFGQVASGQWHLTVTAFDSSGTAIFRGETDVIINPGIVNTVFLHLDPLTGGLVVTADWGSFSEHGEFLYFYSHYNHPRVVYRYNFQTALVEQLTFNDGETYPLYLPNLNKLGYVRLDFGDYWIMNPNGSGKAHLFDLPTPNLFLQNFSMSDQRIYSYVKDPWRRVVSLKYDGTDYREHTLNDSYNNGLPAVNAGGDSLLYGSDRTGAIQIFLLDLETMEDQQLTNSNSPAAYPTWDFQHNGFYYVSFEENGMTTLNFYSFSDGSNVLVLAPPGLFIHLFCGLSPDSSKLAMTCSSSPDLYSAPQNIYMLDLQSGDFTQLTFNNDWLVANPRWMIY